MLLLDNMRNTTGFNTVLRTCIQAASATDAIFGDKISLFFFLSCSKRKRISFNGPFRQVKPLSVTLIDLKDSQCFHGFFCGINLIHVLILFKQFRYFLKPQVSDFAPDRYCHAVHGVIAFCSCQCKKLSLLQSVIKTFTLCRQEIKATFISIHHVDCRCYRQAVIINCCDYHGMDFLHDIF